MVGDPTVGKGYGWASVALVVGWRVYGMSRSK
jgi:hypothetical protein